MGIPLDEDLSLSNVDKMLRSVTEVIQDQIFQEEKSQLTAAQTDEEVVVVEVITPVQDPPV